MSSHEPQPPDVPGTPGATTAASLERPSESGSRAPESRGGKVGKIIGASFALSCVLAVMLLAFALPAVNGGPGQLSVGVLRSQADALPEQSAADAPSPDIETYGDEAALRQAVLDRDVNGGFVVSEEGVTVYTATAGGAPAANALTRMGQTIAGQAGVDANVNDLVPFPEDDPQGTGLNAAALPMIVGGVLPAVAFLRIFPARGQLHLRLLGAGLFSLLAGLAVASVMRFVLGTIDDSFALVALGLSLGMAALALPFLGLEALFGLPGLGGGVALMMLVGNPLSGLPTGSEWLPGGWSTLGQLLPPGASGSLLRANAYFDGVGVAMPLIVLGAWVTLGALLAFVAAGRRATPASQEAR